uniref:Uncharacterized protein n=1 Tax=Alexandrium catenella TaxID=2925 RepID=A0A7S1LMT5_ALECA|mmetsp:Transcript_11655/g.31806  ORF Transcript_11655/g.31806 Transcript_11655/m.31806 type:complete len:364 (+) Transcript_11655:74-1165(+)
MAPILTRRGSNSHGHHHWAAKCKLDFSREFEQKGIPLQDDPDERNAKDMVQLTQFFGMEEAEVQHRQSQLPIAWPSEEDITLGQAVAGLKAKTVLWRKVQERRALRLAELQEPAVEAPVEKAVEKAVGKVPFLLAVPESSQPAVERRRTWGLSLCDALIDGGAADHSMEACDISGRFAKSANERIHRPVTPRDLLDARPPVQLSLGDFPPIFERNRDRPQESHYNYFSRRIPEERPELRKVMELRAQNTRRLYDGRVRALPALDGGEQVAGHALTDPCLPGAPSSPKTQRGRFRTDPSELVLPAATREESQRLSSGQPSSGPPSLKRAGASSVGPGEVAKMPNSARPARTLSTARRHERQSLK